MAHLPCLLALPFLFLGFHVLPSHGSPLPPTYDGSVCADSFKCGSVDISYPFYLSSATKETANYTSYSCGYTDLMISCQDEGETTTPIIQLHGDSYTVLSISYDNYTIILADTDAVRDGKDCPRVRHNVTFGTEWLHYTNSSDNLNFFFGCYHTPSDRRPPPNPDMDMYQINCSGFNPPGSGVSFVFPTEEYELPKEQELAVYCDQVFVAPVKRDLLMKSNMSMWGSGGYGTLLKRGFELAWNRITTDRCYQCEEADGRCSYSKNREFLGCLCRDGKVGISNCTSSGSSTAPPPPKDEKKRRKIYIIASTSGILLLCLLFFAFLMGSKKYRSKKRSTETPSIESFLQKNGTLHPKRYTYAQVKRMTNSFAEKLGQGGFGVVYRGDLSDGHQIAVKMLKDSKADGEEFINEVASISKTSHVNVVTLLGFCLEGSRRALIYDYMPNGSLERYAFNDNSKGENTLSWEKLFDIAVGIARGLEYLHRGCNTRIVHFDIKPHNILLDQDFCPKISDFGLAKLCLNKDSVISIGGARGTIGYIAPEVYSKQFGTISSKSDVYSYGMMVLEMVGARDKNIDANSESSSQYFPQWIYDHLDEYCVGASEINGEVTEIVRKMIVVGLWCIQLSPTNRPTMTRVVDMLEESTSGLELPPKVLMS